MKKCGLDENSVLLEPHCIYNSSVGYNHQENPNMSSCYSWCFSIQLFTCMPNFNH